MLRGNHDLIALLDTSAWPHEPELADFGELLQVRDAVIEEGRVNVVQGEMP